MSCWRVAGLPSAFGVGASTTAQGVVVLDVEEAPVGLDRTRWLELLVGLERVRVCWRWPVAGTAACTWL